MVKEIDAVKLAYIISAGNYYCFEGVEWEKLVGYFIELCEGDPQKCRDMLCKMSKVENPLTNPTERKILNTYLELMLYASNKRTCPEERNT